MLTIILIFRDQTLVGELQANMLKSAVGPSLSWFDEHIRYERLFMASPDGSISQPESAGGPVGLARSEAHSLREAASPTGTVMRYALGGRPRGRSPTSRGSA